MTSVVQTANATGLSGNATFGSGITLGNYLVIATTAYSNSATVPTNSASPTLGGTAPAGATQLLYQGGPASTDTVALAIWLLPVTAAIAGATAVACTWANDTGIAGVVAYETAGWSGVPVLDASASANGSSTAVGSGTSGAIKFAPELVVGTSVGYGQAQGSPAGYTSTSSGTGFQATGYQVAASSGGTYSYAATAGSAANWAAAVITLGVAARSYSARPVRAAKAPGLTRGIAHGTKAAAPAAAGGTAYTLFSGNVHGLNGSGDTGSFTLGVQFSVSQSVSLTGIWFYSGSDVAAATLPTTCVLYDIATTSQVAGTLNTSATWSGAPGSGWVKCSYNGSVTLVPGHNYVACVWSNNQSTQWFEDAANYWTTGGGASGITNGPLSAPSSSGAVNGQAVYNSSGSIAFPATTVNGYDFGVDVEVTTFSSGGTTATPQPSRPVRSRTTAPARGRNPRASSGTAGTAVTGVTGTVTAAAPAGTVQAVTGSPGRNVRARPAPPVRSRTSRASRGTLGTAITGVTGDITVTGAAGTVTAVTGTPGRTVQRQLPAPRRGQGRGTFAVQSAPGVVTGVTGQISVSAPAGIVQAYTGVTGRIIKATPAAPRRGTAHGLNPAVTVPGVVSGVPGQVSVSAPAGNITAVTGTPGRLTRARTALPHRGAVRASQVPSGSAAVVTGVTGTVAVSGPAGIVTAVTGSPGRAIRKRPPAPARGTGHGIFAVTPVPGVVTGSTGLIRVTAPAGTVTATGGTPAAVAGPAGKITITAVVGTVTAVTDIRQPAVRPRTPLPPPAHRGHGATGTRGAILQGVTGTVAVRAVPGTVAAITGSPGRTVRSRTAAPPRHGTGAGQQGTAGYTAAAPPGAIGVAGPAGAVSVTVNGAAGTVAVTAPAGYVVLVPRRYTRWRIPRGFARTRPRSHVVAGSTGMIGVRAPSGAVTATQGTEGTADAAGRNIRAPGKMPPPRGKAK